jgi:hypothetical protein
MDRCDTSMPVDLMGSGFLWDAVVAGAFVLLVVVPVVLQARKLPARIRSARQGIRGVIYVPLTLVVLIPTALLAYVVSRSLQFLQWGWLGINIVAAPLMAVAGTGNESGSLVLLAIVIALLVPALVLFNYIEEREYRDSWRGVGIWAVSHLIMGIPLFAVFPIFATGIVYKVVYDRRGLETAYVAHLTTNCVLLAIVLVSVV